MANVAVLVTFSTKATIDGFALPSFQDGSGFAACAAAVVTAAAHNAAMVLGLRLVATS